MSMQGVYTIGHQVGQSKNVKKYIGCSNTESLAIGEKVSKSVATEVEISDKLVVRDVDKTPNLSVGFVKTSEGTALSITNSHGEFETITRLPLRLDHSQLERGKDLAKGFHVETVSVEKCQDGTYILVKDTCAAGLRTILVDKGGMLTEFLREA